MKLKKASAMPLDCLPWCGTCSMRNREWHLDYAEIVDAETFEPIPMSLRGACYVLIAAKVGGTRLIDNALIEQDGDGFEVTV